MVLIQKVTQIKNSNTIYLIYIMMVLIGLLKITCVQNQLPITFGTTLVCNFVEEF